jgi:predicted TPR repeat methyltransferase
MLAAVGGTERPRRASDGYVRATFDDFADSFDRNLEELGYRAPQVLWEAVSGACGLESRSALAVLDLGCGTGLCGPFLRPVARRLVGIDLSPNMLSKAAARAVYDQLNCGELTRWLAECGQRFDLAVAADVLCYFGDLSAAFANVHGVLLPGGYFACSLEALPAPESADDGFVLRPHGRYQHERSYVERTLAAAHLQTVSIATETLRYERQDPVVGLLVVAKRAADPGSE